MTDTTTILGVIYAGKPLFRSLALQLWLYEHEGHPDKAQALLDAENRIRKAFGHEPIDLTRQFTADPMSMAAQCPSALARVEADLGFEPASFVLEPLSELRPTGTNGGTWL